MEIDAPMPKTKPPRETGHDVLRRWGKRNTLVPIAPGVEMVAVEGEVALRHPEEIPSTSARGQAFIYRALSREGRPELRRDPPVEPTEIPPGGVMRRD